MATNFDGYLTRLSCFSNKIILMVLKLFVMAEIPTKSLLRVFSVSFFTGKRSF